MEDGLKFEQWFEQSGFSENRRELFAMVWNSALLQVERDMDEDLHWIIEDLKA